MAQERFLARLASVQGGNHFVWKGGSLVLRLYSHSLPNPRFTVDVDLLVKGISVAATEDVFREAMSVQLSDGFQFIDLKKSPMEREIGRHLKRPRFEVLDPTGLHRRIIVECGQKAGESGIRKLSKTDGVSEKYDRRFRYDTAKRETKFFV